MFYSKHELQKYAIQLLDWNEPYRLNVKCGQSQCVDLVTPSKIYVLELDVSKQIVYEAFYKAAVQKELLGKNCAYIICQDVFGNPALVESLGIKDFPSNDFFELVYCPLSEEEATERYVNSLTPEQRAFFEYLPEEGRQLILEGRDINSEEELIDRWINIARVKKWWTIPDNIREEQEYLDYCFLQHMADWVLHKATPQEFDSLYQEFLQKCRFSR